MDNKKGTIYQQLNQMFNLDGMGFQVTGNDVKDTATKKIIIKGNSPEEIARKALEIEQKNKLYDKFNKTTDRNYQKALQYEAARLPAYMDYEGMEYYPIISSALDLFMEEATTMGIDGKVLNIYSNKERIKNILEEFYYDILNINTNLPFWTRNTPVKYDSAIPLLNGEIISIKELSERLKENPHKEIWTYSIQDNTKKVMPGKIIWCDLTRKDSEIIRVTFDDDTCVETTSDHEYMLRNGSYVRADELKEGVSLMPFYTLTSNESNLISGYERVYDPSSNRHIFTHRLVAKECIVNSENENKANCDFAKSVNPNFIDHPNFRRASAISATRGNKNCILNHKVKSVERISEKYDVYCMEVVGPNNEQDRHNFPICSKNENGEYTRNGVFLSNCKYGDNFVLLYGEKNKGITAVKQMVNYDIERTERVINGKPTIKFKERMTGDEFNTFEIAHFRLLGDDKYIPYGSSMLNKVRRVFRQLIMAEDAMLTYRIIRAGEKKVFKIDVGNMDEDDIEEYMYKVATKFKKTQQINPNSGQIDYRFNVLGNDEDYFLPMRNANTQSGIDTLPGACLALNTQIELLDGRSLELQQIINEYEAGKKLWSYSINPQTGLIVPAKITWAGVTRKNTEVLKLTLDNGKSIICTPDHKFNTRLGNTKEAKDLIVGESLWSFNKKFETIKNSKNNGKYDKDYEMVYDHSKQEYVYTHRLVKDYLESQGINNVFVFDEKHVNDKKTVIHHSNLNRYDNSPDNLVSMGYVDHFKYHSNLGISNMSDVDMAERVKKLNAGFINYLNNLSEDQKILRNTNISNKRKKAIKNFTPEQAIKFLACGTKNVTSEKSRNTLKEVMKTDTYREIKRIQGKRIRANKEINNRIKISQSYVYNQELLKYLIEFVKENDDRLESFVNHINTEFNAFKTIFIELNKNKPFYKSFTKFTRKNVLKLIRYYNYNDWSHFIENVPCYNHTIVSIEYLTEKQDTGTITIDGNEEFHNYHNFALTCGVFTKNSNLNDIHDIEYLRDNLFVGLGIPKPFLSFQDATGGGKNVAQFDVRFAKKVNRVQKSMVQELTKMGMIHLYLMGYGTEDWNDFTLALSNPSSQLEIQNAETMRNKAQTYTELTRSENGIAAMSHTGAKRLIFNMSDKQIVEDLKQQKMEKVVMQEFADAPVLIKKSGLFADIDARYGSGGTVPASGSTLPQAPMGGAPMGGAPVGGEAPMGGAPIGGGGAPAGGGGELPPMTAEGYLRKGKKNFRNKPPLTDEEFDSYVNELVYGEKIKADSRVKIITETELNKVNGATESMIKEIDELINDGNDDVTEFVKKLME
jgi:hypothetical protein